MSMDYGFLITKLRKYLGITIKEFASKIGIDTSTEFQNENSGRVPEKIIETICNVFNVNMDYFEEKISVEDAISFSGDNPSVRKQKMISILFCGIATAGLGALTIFTGFFWNMLN